MRVKVLLESPRRRIVRRVRAVVTGEEKKRFARITSPEKIDRARCDPIGRVQVFLFVPRAGNKGIAVEPGFEMVRITAPGFIAEPEQVVVVTGGVFQIGRAHV